MSEERSALDRILSALNHPVRRDILRELVGGPNSASKLARGFGIDLGIVSYHLNQVLAKQCKVVELVDTVPRRGSIEKIYAPPFELPADLPHPGKPGSHEEALWTMALAELLLESTKGQRRGSRWRHSGV